MRCWSCVQGDEQVSGEAKADDRQTCQERFIGVFAVSVETLQGL